MQMIRTFVTRHYGWLLFLVITAIGMYLRFWHIGNSYEYGFDQVRDAWKVRDILNGKLILDGPRTGVGDFHIGPLWYYYLTPFYWYFNRDPIAAMYANIPINLFNFAALYWVTNKIFGRPFALVSVAVLAVSRYLITITMVPWNVAPVIGVSALILYGLYRIVFERSRWWIPGAVTLAGLFFHLHAAFVFVVGSIAVTLLALAPDRRVVIKWALLSLPLFFIWFIPIIIFNLQQINDVGRLQGFATTSVINGFHPRIMARQAISGLAMFQVMWGLGGDPLLWTRFVVPVLFAVLTFFTKNAYDRRLYWLLAIWCSMPVFMYMLYTGPTSEYYVLLTAPVIVWIVLLLLRSAARRFGRRGEYGMSALVVVALVGFTWWQTTDLWIKPEYAGYWRQRDWAIDKVVRKAEPVEFSEGDISSYFHALYHEDRITPVPLRQWTPQQ